MSKGYGKRTKLSEYKIQGRGGSGVKTAQVTPKTGEIIGAKVVMAKTAKGGSPNAAEAFKGDFEEELVVISKKGQVIRTNVTEIPSLSRATQGVRVMRLYPGDSIASMVAL
jgi:DNA gyrase subunit A